MNISADKFQGSKNRINTNVAAQMRGSSKSIFQLDYNRSQAIAQRKLQEMVNQSPQVQQLKNYQEMANNYTSETKQRKEILDNELLQGKAVQVLRSQSHSIQNAIIQRLMRTDKGDVWSNNGLFVTNYENNVELLGSRKDPPALAGVEWADAGIAKHKTFGQVTLHRPTTEEGDPSVIPQDCITAAELISAWIRNSNLEDVGTVIIPPKVRKANINTPIGPGDILFHSHTKKSGDFHGAAVIAVDGTDAITMEADASKNKIGSKPPIFDMYAGHSGFGDEQHQGEPDERTYVIHVERGRNKDEKLWAGIQEEIDKHNYSNKGAAAATFIKDAIQIRNDDNSMVD